MFRSLHTTDAAAEENHSRSKNEEPPCFGSSSHLQGSQHGLDSTTATASRMDTSEWMSLLELLSWSEFIVTTDQTTLWRRHIAWAKKEGSEIRNYTTQRFASIMVFLSLLLSAEMGVLFNSSMINAQVRASLKNDEFCHLKFWIGVVLAVGSCITVLGLVCTFTAWGLISAISDVNSHALLRSTMGQTVTALPARLSVAAMYLFLLWLVLFIVELTSGMVSWLIAGFIVALFFHTVSALSVFGRLIIHTGAMGPKPVLDPELERYLLPSGLNSSLLIKAVIHRRRGTDVVKLQRQRGDTMELFPTSTRSSTSQLDRIGDDDDESSDRASSQWNSLRHLDVEDVRDIQAAASVCRSVDRADSGSPVLWGLQDSSRLDTNDPDEVDIKLPRASVLNSLGRRQDLLKFVDSAFIPPTGMEPPAPMEAYTPPSNGDPESLPSTATSSGEATVVRPARLSSRALTEQSTIAPLVSGMTTAIPRPPTMTRHRSVQLQKLAREQSVATFNQNSTRALQEITDEESVRDMYNIEPALTVLERVHSPRPRKNHIPPLSTTTPANNKRGLFRRPRRSPMAEARADTASSHMTENTPLLPPKIPPASDSISTWLSAADAKTDHQPTYPSTLGSTSSTALGVPQADEEMGIQDGAFVLQPNDPYMQHPMQHNSSHGGFKNGEARAPQLETIDGINHEDSTEFSDSKLTDDENSQKSDKSNRKISFTKVKKIIGRAGDGVAIIRSVTTRRKDEKVPTVPSPTWMEK